MSVKFFPLLLVLGLAACDAGVTSAPAIRSPMVREEPIPGAQIGLSREAAALAQVRQAGAGQVVAARLVKEGELHLILKPTLPLGQVHALLLSTLPAMHSAFPDQPVSVVAEDPNNLVVARLTEDPFRPASQRLVYTQRGTPAGSASRAGS